MWYYVKNQKKIGPISDSALSKLFFDGDIDASTSVWSDNLKKSHWVKFSSTHFYAKITSTKEDPILLELIRWLRFLRAGLISFISLILLKFFYTWQSYGHFLYILQTPPDDLTMSDKLATSENYLTLMLISNMQIAMAVVILYFLYKWMYNAVCCTRTLNSFLRYTPNWAAWSTVIPFVNLFIPCKILWKMLKALSLAGKAPMRAFDMTAIILTEIFWILLNVIFLIRNYGYARTGTLDQVSGLHIFSTYNSCISLITVILLIIVVSRISHLQKLAFGHTKL